MRMCGLVHLEEILSVSYSGFDQKPARLQFLTGVMSQHFPSKNHNNRTFPLGAPGPQLGPALENIAITPAPNR